MARGPPAIEADVRARPLFAKMVTKRASNLVIGAFGGSGTIPQLQLCKALDGLVNIVAALIEYLCQYLQHERKKRLSRL